MHTFAAAECVDWGGLSGERLGMFRTRLQSQETPVAVTPLLRRSPERNGHKWLPVFMGTAVHPAATDTVHLIKSELFKYLMINDQGSTF